MFITYLDQLLTSKSNDPIAVPCHKNSSHYIGKNSDNRLCLYIRTRHSETMQRLSSNGRLLNIIYCVECDIHNFSSNEKFKDRFSIIEYKGEFEKSSIVSYLLNVWEALIRSLGENPTIEDIHNEVEKVRILFVKLNKKPIQTELGLWGELFCIANSPDKYYWIKSWHKKKSDKFDFNDGLNLLEVKTTLKNKREHEFSLDQLANSRTKDLLIISIMTIETDFGASVQDLYSSIIKELNYSEKNEFTDKLFENAGNEIEQYTRKFDYNHAKNRIRYYDPSHIPSINPDMIDLNISNVRFVSNLEKTPCIAEQRLCMNQFKIFHQC